MHQTKNVSLTQNRAVISVHTKLETSQRLDLLAATTRRSKSYLANEALERYLSEEEAFLASVERGLADAAAHRVMPTNIAQTQLHTRIDTTTI